MGNIQPNLRGLTKEQAREVVKETQKDLVKSAGKLSAGHSYNLAFFRMIFTLANGFGDLDPIAVVTRHHDGEIFLFG